MSWIIPSKKEIWEHGANDDDAVREDRVKKNEERRNKPSEEAAKRMDKKKR